MQDDFAGVRMRGPGWPVARPNMRVGLLGGSFDPAHTGHVHVSRAALTRFGLDRVWWLVSPGNPLKPDAPAPLDRRLARARTVMDNPRVEVTDLEARMNTRYTADTLRGLRARYPGVRFVWLMGADNLAGFHHWDEWRRIFRSTPIGVIARPGQRISANMSMAARAFDRARVPPNQSRRLARAGAPAWCFVNIPMREESSSALRRSGDWKR